jgi:NADH-quinone oxidoreductase subunit A
MTAPLLILAQAADAVTPNVGGPTANWAAVLLLLLIGVLFVVGTLTMSLLVGPARTGEVKSSVYESGVNPVGDSRKRFNVRFYVVAMIFLVFDVDIVFFYPLCAIFRRTVTTEPAAALALLVDILIFVAILLVAYLYAWGKGVFRWD